MIYQIYILLHNPERKFQGNRKTDMFKTLLVAIFAEFDEMLSQIYWIVIDV